MNYMKIYIGLLKKITLNFIMFHSRFHLTYPLLKNSQNSIWTPFKKTSVVFMYSFIYLKKLKDWKSFYKIYNIYKIYSKYHYIKVKISFYW